MAAATIETTPYLKSAGKEVNGFHQVVVHNSRTSQSVISVHFAHGFNIELTPGRLPRHWKFDLTIHAIVFQFGRIRIRSLDFIGDDKVSIAKIVLIWT